MGGDPPLARSLLALLCVCCVLSPRHVHTDVHTDGAYLLLAGGARCVRGRIANCRADPMVASSSAAATDPLLFFAAARRSAPKTRVSARPHVSPRAPFTGAVGLFFPWSRIGMRETNVRKKDKAVLYE